MTEYSEKLKDPRWQKLRLEALSRHNWRCEICSVAESTLHVHHKEYFKGHEPWEYGLGQLSVLCDGCHTAFHDSCDELKWVCSFADLDGPKGRTDASVVLAGFLNIDYLGFLTFTGLPDLEHYQMLYKRVAGER